MRFLFVVVIAVLQFSCDNLIEKPIPIEKNAMGATKILIVSHHTLDANYLDYTWHNHKAYAKQGYDYWFRNGIIDNTFVDPNGKNSVFKHGLYWQKIAAVQQALKLRDAQGQKMYEWVMWIDADALFTDFKKNIETILSGLTNNEFLVISQDYGEYCANTGVWLIKNDSRSDKFLKLVVDSFPFYKEKQYPEQDAVVDIIFGYLTQATIESKVANSAPRACRTDEIIAGVKVLPQRAMNSYYTTYAVALPGSSWHSGDYIAHFAAGGDKRNLMKRLVTCMKEKEKDLTGCEVNGFWQSN